MDKTTTMLDAGMITIDEYQKLRGMNPVPSPPPELAPEMLVRSIDLSCPIDGLMQVEVSAVSTGPADYEGLIAGTHKLAIVPRQSKPVPKPPPPPENETWGGPGPVAQAICRWFKAGCPIPLIGRFKLFLLR